MLIRRCRQLESRHRHWHGAVRDDIAARSAVLGAHDVDSEPPDAATGVPAHGNRRRVGPAFCGDRCAFVGQRRRFFLPRALGDDARDRPRRGRCRARSSPLGEQRLMTFFFFVLGLEASEFDLGELRRAKTVRAAAACRNRGWQRRSPSPRFNAGGSSAHGWGIAMSTARPLRSACSRSWGGVFPTACGYSSSRLSWSTTSSRSSSSQRSTSRRSVSALSAALGVFGVVLVVRALRVRRARLRGARGGDLGSAARVGRGAGGRGLAMGLLAYASTRR